ncbi:hypothetical protein QAD02_022028 [Eretmocerus hayati]|uniref:Uncharacterized protein n=1 Tax=Eretmocerus hayati TaxID=131215 RepID=A0ACC2PSE3_9HYME|nr:hypothetical protein QAD02_022028 [Eretmocerus hayati]
MVAAVNEPPDFLRMMSEGLIYVLEHGDIQETNVLVNLWDIALSLVPNLANLATPPFAVFINFTSFSEPPPNPIIEDIQVINKQEYIPASSSNPPQSGNPNAGLSELLTHGFDSSVHSLDESALMRLIASRPSPYLYCYNLGSDHLPADFEGYLEKDPVIRRSSVDPSVNRLINTCPGINTSFLYIAGTLAFGEMNLEDPHLGSFNLVLTHLNNYQSSWPAKLWIIAVDNQKFIRVVRTVYKPPKKSSESICQYILHHKNLFISVDFLKKHGIRYEVILQAPGDCVYVFPGVFHQVINLTPNVAEAKNYGCGFWNKLVRHLTTCGCPLDQYSLLPANPDLDVNISSRLLKAYICETPECDFVSWNKKLYDDHLKNDHPTPAPETKRYIVFYAKNLSLSPTSRSISKLEYMIVSARLILCNPIFLLFRRK